MLYNYIYVHIINAAYWVVYQYHMFNRFHPQVVAAQLEGLSEINATLQS